MGRQPRGDAAPAGAPRGGDLGHGQHPGGGEGAEGKRQRAGPDAFPGGGAAVQVVASGRRCGWRRGRGRGGGRCLRARPWTQRQAPRCPLPLPSPAEPPPPRPPHPPAPGVSGGGWLVGSRRALQHSNLLQCLAQCTEVTPYLLVMEFCPMVSRHSLASGRSALSCAAREGGPSLHTGAFAELGTPWPHTVGLICPLNWGSGMALREEVTLLTGDGGRSCWALPASWGGAPLPPSPGCSALRQFSGEPLTSVPRFHGLAWQGLILGPVTVPAICLLWAPSHTHSSSTEDRHPWSGFWTPGHSHDLPGPPQDSWALPGAGQCQQGKELPADPPITCPGFCPALRRQASEPQ